LCGAGPSFSKKEKTSQELRPDSFGANECNLSFENTREDTLLLLIIIWTEWLGLRVGP
jgi:hypothetical protein